MSMEYESKRCLTAIKGLSVIETWVNRLKMYFTPENFYLYTDILSSYIHTDSIYDKLSLLQKMAWCLIRTRLIYESTMTKIWEAI